MKYIYLTLSWLFGILFILSGLITLTESPFAGITMIAASFLILPPIRNFVYGKTKKELSFKARSLTAFVLLAVAGMFIGQSQDKKVQELAANEAKEQAEKIALIKKQNINHFHTNKELIIATLKTEFNSKNYQEVISKSSKYLASGDAELSELHTAAKENLNKIQKDKKTKNLLTELKKTPAKELEKNKKLYNQLVSLHPDNKKYKGKVEFYSKKIEKQKEIKLAAEARTKNIKTQFSAWDGSHYQLEKLIKRGMNDPDSYEHDETVYWDKSSYIIVKTTYRGRNAFGGTVRNFVKAKISLNGQILQILDQT